MRLFWYLLVAPMTAVGVITGAILFQSHAALSPVLESADQQHVPLASTQSLEDLITIRDRLLSEIEKQPPTLIAAASGLGGPTPSAITHQLHAVAVRIEIEEMARENLSKAFKLAEEAVRLGNKTTLTSATQAELQRLYQLWDQAVAALSEIPEESFLSQQAIAKRREYEANRAYVGYYYDTIRSGFLKKIAESTGLGDRVHLTVCNLQRECRRLRGNQPPASPASLIKVPVAIALMAKLAAENISPETKILVSPGNWTEDAGKIWVGSEYSLRAIMADMISYSGNIATNQLIDYLGFDYINRVMRDRGYNTTRVNTKLVGESTYPANLGTGPNVLTTDELTDMMVGIYNNEHPGDDLILDALVKQYDWELGYEAIKRPAVWIGEKTGQNSKVLGTTVGVNIQGERYIITVAINYTGSEPAVKQAVKGVVDHLIRHRGFGG
ncbi:MAG TPA: serine hydrolase [Synechococcales cyanobacterium M55_K2018_004]|nr:serine hydrolase [Synechococcales cyanobacterium M55_K2018_004]